MGGNLLQPTWGLPPKRLPKADYERLEKALIAQLQDFTPGRRFRSLRAFSDKQDFGDLDILCEAISGDTVNWLQFFEELSGGMKPHKNGKTITIPIDGFQVDFTFAGSETYDIAYTYYAFEAGNFMGRISDKLGFKYGHHGLSLHIPLSYFDDELPSHQYRDILVTRNPKEIFTILGFDYEEFKEGFANFDEMSEWVARSFFFNPELFDFESLNSINRTRNRKRPVYAKFVEWCKTQPANNPLQDVKQLREDIIGAFDHIPEEIESVRKEIQLNKARRAKFNGELIKRMFGLEGKALGDFIVSFKKKFNDFDAYLDENLAEHVSSDIVYHYIATVQS